jgi:hypothetical protein
MLDNNITRLLADIKKRPGVYIGKKSLDRLATFISGYMCCVHERDGASPEYLPGFQEFIAERYNIHSVHGWPEIIQFFNVTEEDAFDEFYRLLNTYYKTHF